ncbi:MAG: helix-turn-helix domain-containing protein [Desulfotignum sp.]|nr:helix-turn-helix domain-containing protein [Desulfobacteraceae bacterium]
MSAPTNNVQVIRQNGVPAFAVIPYDDYLAMLPEKIESDSVPREVAEKAILEDMPMIKAWRLHLGLTQKEVAKKAGITQAALSQMERAENTNRNVTLEKLALAMGVSVGQVQD